MNFLIALAGETTEAATSAASSAASSGFSWATVQQYLFPALMIIGLVLVFWLLIIRPQKKQEKETTKMRDSLEIGDEITTIGGIIGEIVSIKGETITIETSKDRTKIRLLKDAVKVVDVKASEGSED